MARCRSINPSNNLSFKLLFLFFLFFSSLWIYGQSPVNFSGVWTQDNSKSDDFYKDFNVNCTITQTPQSITIKQTFFDKDGKEITSHDYFFNLDGKENSKEENGGINKEQAKWSPDKKILTTTSTRTVGKNIYGSIESYSISENGLVLTVHTSDINPGGLSVIQILNKKR